MVGKPVAEMDAGEVLDAVEAWHVQRSDLEMRTFVAAAHFAHPPRPDIDIHHTAQHGRHAA